MAADSIETGMIVAGVVAEASRGRRLLVASVLAGLFGAGLHVAVNGYSFGGCTERLPAASPSGDHANILPWVYWYQDNSLFPHDLQIRSGASYATVLWRIVAWCGGIAPLPYVFFAFHLIALIATYAALFSLGRLLGENAWAGGMACALFLVAHEAPAGEATHDPAFYTRMAALPLVLVSIHGALRAQPLLTFGALMSAVAVHLLTAIYATPIVLGLWLLATGPTRRTRLLWLGVFVAAAIGIVFLLGGGAGITLGRPSPEWLDLQRGNNVMHLFPSTWPPSIWIPLASALALLSMALFKGTTPTLRRFALTVIISCAALAVAGWAFAEKWPSMLIMQFQLLRCLKIGMILAFVGGAAWLCRSLTPLTGLAAVASLIAWTGHYYLASLTILGIAFVLRFVPVIKVNSAWRKLGRGGVAVGLIGFSILLVRSATERKDAPGGSHEYRYRPSLDLPWRVATSPWVDVQRWIAANTQTDAFFITPPILEGFRTYARRSEFVDWKQGTLSLFHERFGTEWLRRLARLMTTGGRLTYLDIYNRYNSLTAADFQALAGEYGLTHAVTMAPIEGLSPLHRNQVFFVYQLR